MNVRFGWDVGEEAAAIPQWSVCRNKEVAERLSQAPNGSAARLRESLSRDERGLGTWRVTEVREPSSPQLTLVAANYSETIR